MVGMIIAASGAATFLLLGEILWRYKITKGETARKFIHITVASFAAFWPTFISREEIALLSFGFVVALVLVKRLNLLRSVHSVQRTTYGEIWYAVGIGVMALLFTDNVIYAVAVLHMALADGFAAVVGGVLAEKARHFHFRTSRKSIEGTLTFVAISMVLNLCYWYFAAPINLNGIVANLSPAVYSLLSAGLLACFEIMSPKGSDNVIVPFAAGGLLWLPLILLG